MKQKILYWFPRVLAILAILFMMLFSMDCFGGTLKVKEQLICFMMHNIPAFIIMLVVIVAWRWEIAGGVLFLLVAIAGSIYFRSFNGNPGVIIILLPFVITGILFILHQVLSKKNQNN